MNILITFIRQFFGIFKKVSDCCFVRQHPAHYSQDIECRPIKFAIVLDNSNQTVRDYRNIDLYSHCIFGVSPKGCNPKMLLYPSEEQFNLPSLLVQQGHITGLKHEVVCQERESPLEFRGVVDYSPEFTWKLLLGLSARKSYCLVKKNVVRLVKQVLPVNCLITEAGLLSDDKIGVDDVDFVQSGKVVIPLVKDVERIRLIRDVIHRINIMDFSFRNMNVCGNLGDNVKQGMNFDSSFCLPEESPLEQAKTEVYGGGVKSIEFSVQDELPVQSLALGKTNHIVGELLEYPVVPVRIGIGNVAELDVSATKSEMVTLGSDGVNDTDDFSETVATRKLSEHHHKKLVPTRERFYVFVATVLLDYSIKNSFRQKLHELTEKIFSAIHAVWDLIQAAKIHIKFKSTRVVFAYNELYIS